MKQYPRSNYDHEYHLDFLWIFFCHEMSTQMAVEDSDIVEELKNK